MRLYKVYAKKTDEGIINDIIVFREGFSWLAFLFSFIWLLYHKLWIKLAQALIVVYVSGIFGNYSFEVFLDVVVILSIAFYGYDWYSEKLRNKYGYVFEGYEFVKNKDEALLKFISNNKDKISYPKNKDSWKVRMSLYVASPFKYIAKFFRKKEKIA